mgnify:CR=1 FL=1
MSSNDFRDVVGYEQYFSVSCTGEVWSKRSRKLLRTFIHKNGYVVLSTRIGGRMGKALCLKVHRLVAGAWVDNPDSKPFVNHKDGM